MKDEDFLQKHYSEVSHTPNKLIDVMQLNKLELLEEVNDIETSPCTKLQYADYCPYTVDSICYFLTQLQKKVLNKEISQEDLKNTIQLHHVAGSGDFVSLNISWEDFKKGAIGDYVGQYKSFYNEVYKLWKNPPVKLFPYNETIEDDKTKISFKELKPFEIFSKSTDVSVKNNSISDIETTGVTVMVYEPLVHDLLCTDEKSEFVRFVPFPKAFYAGLVDTVKKSKYLNLISNSRYSPTITVDDTNISLTTFRNAINYIYKHTNHKGNKQVIDILDFWARISTRELARKTHVDGTRSIYLRREIGYSKHFFDTVVFLVQEYFNIQVSDFSAWDYWPDKVECSKKDKTITLNIIREHIPNKFDTENRFKKLCRTNEILKNLPDLESLELENIEDTTSEGDNKLQISLF